jgi:hypothetical protein
MVICVTNFIDPRGAMYRVVEFTREERGAAQGDSEV